MTPALIVADMSVGENFHLQWQDFETNAVSAFKSLLTDKDLLDVTLVSEDDLVMEAHAVVLHSSSNFFRRVLCSGGILALASARDFFCSAVFTSDHPYLRVNNILSIHWWSEMKTVLQEIASTREC